MKESTLRGIIRESIKKAIIEAKHNAAYNSGADYLRANMTTPYHGKNGKIVNPSEKHKAKKSLTPDEIRKEKESWAEAMKQKLNRKDIESCTHGDMDESLTYSHE